MLHTSAVPGKKKSVTECHPILLFCCSFKVVEQQTKCDIVIRVGRLPPTETENEPRQREHLLLTNSSSSMRCPLQGLFQACMYRKGNTFLQSAWFWLYMHLHASTLLCYKESDRWRRSHKLLCWFKHISFRRKGLGVAYNATMPPPELTSPEITVLKQYIKLTRVSEVTDGWVVKAGVSVTWNVLSWSGGHEFGPDRVEPGMCSTSVCPKSYLDPKYFIWWAQKHVIQKQKLNP